MGDLGPKLPLVLVAAALAACSAGATSFNPSGGSTDSGAAPGTADGGTGAFNDATCGSSLMLKTTGPNAPTQLTATLLNNGGVAADLHGYHWRVLRAGAGQPVDDEQTASTTLTLDANAAGMYHVGVDFTSTNQGPCSLIADLRLSPPGAKVAVVRLHVTSPPGSDTPAQDKLVTLYGGTPVDRQVVSLDPGVDVQATLTGPSGPVAGSVRFVDASGGDVLASAAASGAFDAVLLPAATYLAVLVPADATLAPHKFPSPLAGATLAGSSFTVGTGVTVSGLAHDDGGAPLAGARVLLDDTPAVGGVGLAAPDGSWHLATEPDSYTLVATAPGLPTLTVPSVSITADTTVDLSWHGARVPVAGAVVGSDGKPAGGARLTVRGAAPVAKAGVVTIAGTPHDADGTVRATLVTQPDGSFATSLPAGAYQVLVEPPAQSEDGVTQLAATATAGGAPWALALAPKRTLSGTVVDDKAAPIAGASVMALSHAGLGSAPATTTDKNGAFTLSVDTGADVALQVAAPATDASGVPYELVRAQQTIAAGTAPVTGLSVALGPGLLYAGVVHGAGGGSVPGALVEAYCMSCSADVPIATASTDGSGGFALFLVDPGEN